LFVYYGSEQLLLLSHVIVAAAVVLLNVKVLHNIYIGIVCKSWSATIEQLRSHSECPEFLTFSQVLAWLQYK